MSYQAYEIIICPSTKFQSVTQNAQNNEMRNNSKSQNVGWSVQYHSDSSKCMEMSILNVRQAIWHICVKSWMKYKQFCYRQLVYGMSNGSGISYYAQYLDPPHVRFAITVHEITPHDWNEITQSLDTALDISHSQFIFIR